MKILHTLNFLIAGGVERRRLSLFERLPQPEFRHRVVCSEIQDVSFAAKMAASVERIDAIGYRGRLLHPGRYRAVMKIIDEWEPDIIHGAIIDGYTLACVAGWLKRVPVIIMEETSDTRYRRWKGHLLARLMGDLAHQCVAVSPSVGHYLTNEIRLHPRKVRIISNGVEKPESPSVERRRLLCEQYGIDSMDVVIGSVGRMEAGDRKRFSDLVSAFARLDVGVQVKLMLVGDGSERANIERLATSLGVYDRIVFTGTQRNIGHFYSLMHIFALVSEREAFGLVNAEAMRSGLPVVTTAVGGIIDVVKDGETGFLVPVRNVNRISKALEILVKSSELRVQMGNAGKIRADREFSAERYVGNVGNLYRELALINRISK